MGAAGNRARATTTSTSAPWLAGRGYAVFAATYRFAKAGRPTFPSAVQDVRAAVQFVKGQAAELRADLLDIFKVSRTASRAPVGEAKRKPIHDGHEIVTRRRVCISHERSAFSARLSRQEMERFTALMESNCPARQAGR